MIERKDGREVAIHLSGVKKMYKLGQIGGGTLQGDLQSWWARVRGKEDPNTKIGQEQRLVGQTFMALNGIDLTVYKGEALGIIGSNGAGKSTLFKIITGELDYDAGTVFIAPDRHVGVLSQIPVYPAEYTVLDVLDTAFDQLKAMEGAVSDTIKRVSFSTPAYVAAVGASETVLSADAAVAKTGVASAPLKGNAAVYVVQPYAQNKTNDNYDALVEKVMVQNNMVNIARQAFGNDLYLKANVKDSRYLFF